MDGEKTEYSIERLYSYFIMGGEGGLADASKIKENWFLNNLIVPSINDKNS